MAPPTDDGSNHKKRDHASMAAVDDNSSSANNVLNCGGVSSSSSAAQLESLTSEAAILARLDRLEADTVNLRAEVERLQACHPTTLVEFKFINLATEKLVKNGKWNGVLHVPMMQHPVTGVCTVPAGITQVHGQYTVRRYDFEKGLDVNVTETFVAHLERPEDPTKPISKFRLGINLEYGLDDQVFSYVEPAIKSCQKENDSIAVGGMEESSRYPYSTRYIQEFVSTDEKMLTKWEQNQGGVLSFYAPASFVFDAKSYRVDTGEDPHKVQHTAKYKIKLFTVLSAYKPHQTTIPLVPRDAKPGWRLLEVVLKTRFPDRSYADICKAIDQYKLFLELKAEHNDLTKNQKFSPSRALDEIWHAHLSFPDRYQADIQAMFLNSNNSASSTHDNTSKLGSARTLLLEHNPIAPALVMGCYRAAVMAHTERMERLGQTVDATYWPNPPPEHDSDYESADDKEFHDGDSDDALFMPMASLSGASM